MSERPPVTDSEKVVILERFLRRIVGYAARFRYRNMFMNGVEFEIINPDAQRLIESFQPTDVDTIDFDTQVIEDSPENYSWIYRTKAEEEGFPVYDLATGEMIGVNPKFNSVLVATFEQFEDPETQIAELKKKTAENDKRIAELENGLNNKLIPLEQPLNTIPCTQITVMG